MLYIYIKIYKTENDYYQLEKKKLKWASNTFFNLPSGHMSNNGHLISLASLKPWIFGCLEHRIIFFS